MMEEDNLDLSRPFSLDTSVGRTGGNEREDVAKIESLLGESGHLDLARTDGPTGFFGIRLEDAVKDFQKDHGLRTDGLITPGGPTIRALASSLQEMGRHGDTILAHITPQEANLLHNITDGGSINPVTGLPEFWGGHPGIDGRDGPAPGSGNSGRGGGHPGWGLGGSSGKPAGGRGERGHPGWGLGGGPEKSGGGEGGHPGWGPGDLPGKSPSENTAEEDGKSKAQQEDAARMDRLRAFHAIQERMNRTEKEQEEADRRAHRDRLAREKEKARAPEEEAKMRDLQQRQARQRAEKEKQAKSEERARQQRARQEKAMLDRMLSLRAKRERAKFAPEPKSLIDQIVNNPIFRSINDFMNDPDKGPAETPPLGPPPSGPPPAPAKNDNQKEQTVGAMIAALIGLAILGQLANNKGNGGPLR